MGFHPITSVNVSVTSQNGKIPHLCPTKWEHHYWSVLSGPHTSSFTGMNPSCWTDNQRRDSEKKHLTHFNIHASSNDYYTFLSLHVLGIHDSSCKVKSLFYVSPRLITVQKCSTHTDEHMQLYQISPSVSPSTISSYERLDKRSSAGKHEGESERSSGL